MEKKYKTTITRQTRRSFLKTSLYTSAAVSWTAKSWAQVKGANDTLNAGTIGFRGRGNSHIGSIRNMQKAEKGVRLHSLCDVDKGVLQGGVNRYKVKGFTDLRKMLEDKDLDIVTIATPNHWHALASIWAIQAGKDVYVEKPVSHNVWEGRQIVNAARKFKKIVQTGTQARSSKCIQDAVEFVQSGALGKIKVSRGLCYKRRPSIGLTTEDNPIPDSVEYDLWLGPAPKKPLSRKRLHYDWHWMWDYGNGDLGNQGIHQMDIARWFLGDMELSPRVWSVGGRLGYEDDGETANTQVIYHDYKTAPLIFEVRGLGVVKGSGQRPTYRGGSVAVFVECEKGWVAVRNYGSVQVYDNDNKQIKNFGGGGDHFGNFIEAVRSRKPSDLNAEILEGHLSSALCHTGNISHRVGKDASVEDIREAIKGDFAATEAVDRMIDHLAAKNEVDLKATPLTLGPALTMDTKKETFPGNAAANKLLTREYRKPYVVPDLS
ncbi:MAG: dehydrogenase [Verrucomicrobiales bacterium]|nr:dehydrogenase [Verrucomicrobiales bacterium]|tara:strand:+ start:885 stop:2351 length:1467 start_codon:yes stop_codon:yes gene_type:complete